jgi:hypothetical protein
MGINTMDHNKRCPSCGRVYTPDLVDTPDFGTRYQMWAGGVLIQRVWPEATAIQREQLKTGICSDECWDEFLGVVDDGRP